jgi:hypothetical protein
VLVEAVVNHRPAEPLPQAPRERLPGRILDEDDGVPDPGAFDQFLERVERLFERLSLERARVDVEVVFSGQAHLEDAVADARDLEIPIETLETGLCVEDAVPVGGERREQLLRALEPEAPIDDRETKQVEAPGRREVFESENGCFTQETYLATKKRAGPKARPEDGGTVEPVRRRTRRTPARRGGGSSATGSR